MLKICKYMGAFQNTVCLCKVYVPITDLTLVFYKKICKYL